MAARITSTQTMYSPSGERRAEMTIEFDTGLSMTVVGPDDLVRDRAALVAELKRHIDGLHGGTDTFDDPFQVP
jgi:hypothetical protein